MITHWQSYLAHLHAAHLQGNWRRPGQLSSLQDFWRERFSFSKSKSKNRRDIYKSFNIIKLKFSYLASSWHTKFSIQKAHLDKACIRIVPCLIGSSKYWTDPEGWLWLSGGTWTTTSPDLLLFPCCDGSNYTTRLGWFDLKLFWHWHAFAGTSPVLCDLALIRPLFDMYGPAWMRLDGDSVALLQNIPEFYFYCVTVTSTHTYMAEGQYLECWH